MGWKWLNTFWKGKNEKETENQENGSNKDGMRIPQWEEQRKGKDREMERQQPRLQDKPKSREKFYHIFQTCFDLQISLPRENGVSILETKT